MKRRTLPTYCSEFADRHGKWRVRFRRKGFTTYYFRAMPHSQAFMQEYQSCIEGVAALAVEPGSDAIIRGSFSDLISRYYRTPEWLSPGDRTRTINRGVIERFRAEHGHRLVSELTYDKVTVLLGRMSHTPTAANLSRKTLRRIVRYAVQIGMRTDNPFDATKPFKIKSTGHHTWSDDEVRQFETRHPLGTKPRLALALLLQTAQRRSDVVRMGRQHVSRGKIAVRQVKTGTQLLLPMLPELIAAIDAMPTDNMIFLVTAYHKPFTANGFGNWFREQCDAAGLPNCSAHGLRKTAMTRMAVAGFTQQEIKAWSGHKADAEVALYTRDANQAGLAEGSANKLAPRQMANHKTELAISRRNPLLLGR